MSHQAYVTTGAMAVSQPSGYVGCQCLAVPRSTPSRILSSMSAICSFLKTCRHWPGLQVLCSWDKDNHKLSMSLMVAITDDQTITRALFPKVGPNCYHLFSRIPFPHHARSHLASCITPHVSRAQPRSLYGRVITTSRVSHCSASGLLTCYCPH